MAEFRALVLHEQGGRITPQIEAVDDDRLQAASERVALETLLCERSGAGGETDLRARLPSILCGVGRGGDTELL